MNKYSVGQEIFFQSRLFIVESISTNGQRLYKPFTNAVRKGIINRTILMRDDTFKYEIRPLDKETRKVFRTEDQILENHCSQPKYNLDDTVFILQEKTKQTLCPYCNNYIIARVICGVTEAKVLEISRTKRSITYWLTREKTAAIIKLHEKHVYATESEAKEALVEKILSN